jgi:hypothetical protein
MLLPILEKNQLVDAIVLQFYPQIRQWNLDRNNLHFSKDLEQDMLIEEYHEFLSATSAVDMLDAVCDYAFVLCGTYTKWMQHADDSDDMLAFMNKYSSHFVDMYIVFSKYLVQALPISSMEGIPDLIIKGLEVVTKKNYEKGNDLDENGKVKKPEGFVGPEVELQALLDNFTDDIQR